MLGRFILVLHAYKGWYIRRSSCHVPNVPSHAQEMVAMTQQMHSDRPSRIGNWIRLMLVKFDHTRSEEDFNEARFSASEVGVSIEVDDGDQGSMRATVVVPK
jgi:hypothetical protein